MRRELLHGDGFKVEIQRHGEYLRAYVFDGADSRKVSIALWVLLATQCRRYEMTRLLVVEDLEDTVAQTDIESIIEAMIDNGFVDIRTAFVEVRNDHPVNEQGGILALERGITVQVFSNEVEARSWLLYGAD